MPRSGPIRNRKRTEIIIIDIIISYYKHCVGLISIHSPPFREGQGEGLLPFRGGEYCEGYKLIIVIVVIDKNFFIAKSMICLYIPTFLIYLTEIQWNTECIEVVLTWSSIHLLS